MPALSERIQWVWDEHTNEQKPSDVINHVRGNPAHWTVFIERTPVNFDYLRLEASDNTPIDDPFDVHHKAMIDLFNGPWKENHKKVLELFEYEGQGLSIVPIDPSDHELKTTIARELKVDEYDPLYRYEKYDVFAEVRAEGRVIVDLRDKLMAEKLFQAFKDNQLQNVVCFVGADHYGIKRYLTSLENDLPIWNCLEDSE